MRNLAAGWRILAALVTGGVLFYAWYYAVVLLLYPLRERNTWSGEMRHFALWAGGAALIALAARIAGSWRWIVGVPPLLALGGVGFCVYGMLSLGPGSPPGLALGLLLGTFIIGPAILAIPVAAPNGGQVPVPSSAAKPSSRWLQARELRIWVGVLGVLVVPLFSYAGPPALRHWQLERLRRAAIAAVEELVRTDILRHSGSVVWDEMKHGYWRDSPDSGAQGLMSDAKVALSFYSPPFGRQFGRAGRAEGLRVDGLFISVPQPRLTRYA